MAELLNGLGLITDVGFDSWFGSSFFARHPSTSEVHGTVKQLERVWNSTGQLQSDKLVRSLDSDPATLGQSLHRLQHEQLSEESRRQLEANVSLAMRRSVNPHSRQLDSLKDFIKTKIDKRESSWKKNGVLSKSEHEELQKLYESRDILASLRTQAHDYQHTFKSLDADAKIFSKGQKFRRASLDMLHTLGRFNSRHRIFVASSITAILILSSIVSYMNQQAVIKAAKHKNSVS